jgi:hypothetical protein
VNDAITPINRFRQNPRPERKLHAIYTLAVSDPSGKLRPIHRTFAVREAGVTETMNVIRRLIDSPPENTAFKCFTVFPHGIPAADVIGCARSLLATLSNEPNEHEHDDDPVNGSAGPGMDAETP